MTTQYVMKNGIRKLVLRVVLIVTLLCYALPWFSINVMEKPVSHIAGYHFLIGKDAADLSSEVFDTDIKGEDLEKLGIKNQKIIPVSVFAYLAVAMVLAGIFCSFSNHRSGPITATVTGFLGLIFILVAMFTNPVLTQVQYQGMPAPLLETTGDIGFKAVLLLYTLVIVTGITAAIGKYRSPDSTIQQKD